MKENNSVWWTGDEGKGQPAVFTFFEVGLVASGSPVWTLALASLGMPLGPTHRSQDSRFTIRIGMCSEILQSPLWVIRNERNRLVCLSGQCTCVQRPGYLDFPAFFFYNYTFQRSQWRVGERNIQRCAEEHYSIGTLNKPSFKKNLLLSGLIKDLNG